MMSLRIQQHQGVSAEKRRVHKAEAQLAVRETATTISAIIIPMTNEYSIRATPERSRHRRKKAFSFNC